MKKQQQQPRVERPRHFDIFAPGLDHETAVEMVTAWASSKRGTTEPTEREINVLWNLLRVFPEDENRTRRVPEDVNGLAFDWRDTLEGRPEWTFGPRQEER